VHKTTRTPRRPSGSASRELETPAVGCGSFRFGLAVPNVQRDVCFVKMSGVGAGSGGGGEREDEEVDLDRAAFPFITVDEGGKFVVNEDCVRYVRSAHPWRRGLGLCACLVAAPPPPWCAALMVVLRARVEWP
jgi:hypothetical protein